VFAFEKLPANCISVLLSQTDCGPPGEPASTVGAVSIVTTISSDSGLHIPLLVEVAVNVTVPAAISLAEAV
jgi:hypothetical protein